MTKIRIYGRKVGEKDTVIDAKIKNITVSGVATLTDINSDREWDIKLPKLRSYIENNTAVRHSSLSHPDHNIWMRLDDVHKDLSTEPFTSIDVSDNVLDIFKTIVRVMKNYENKSK